MLQTETFRDWQNLNRPAELPRYKAIANLIHAFGPANPTVLDVGCGEGVLFNHLRRGVTYTGVEPSPDACLAAQRPGNAFFEIIQTTAEGFPVSERTWDFVVLSEVLYYCEDHATVLQKYVDAVSPGGRLIVSIFQKPESVGARVRRFLGGAATNHACTSHVDAFFRAKSGHSEEIMRNENGQRWKLWAAKVVPYSVPQSVPATSKQSSNSVPVPLNSH